MGRRAAFAALALLVFAAACSSSPATVVKLDGSPRVPAQEGVVQKASASGLTLDGNRRFTVSPKLISFSTYNQKVVALRSTIGKYVQLGVTKGEITWLALIGTVAVDDQGHQTVIYQGTLKKIVGDQFEFSDGTVLRLAKGLTPPANPLGPTYVVIDAKRHLIQGATFQDVVATTTTTRTKKSG